MTDLNRMQKEQNPLLASKARDVPEEQADANPRFVGLIDAAKTRLREAEAEHTAHVKATQAVREAPARLAGIIADIERAVAEHDAGIPAVAAQYFRGQIGDADLDDVMRRVDVLKVRLVALHKGAPVIEKEAATADRIGESINDRVWRAGEELRALRGESSLDLARAA